MDKIFTAPTREITLPITKAVVTFKEWLTKEESDVTKEPMRKHEVEVRNKDTVQRFAIDVMKEVEKLTLLGAIVKVKNGETEYVENIWDVLKQLPDPDFDFLKEQIDNVLTPPKDQKT